MAIITIVNNIIDIIEDEPQEQRVAKRGRDRKWIKDRDEKGAYSNIILDLSLHDEEGFRRFMRMNYEQFISHIRNLTC